MGGGWQSIIRSILWDCAGGGCVYCSGHTTCRGWGTSGTGWTERKTKRRPGGEAEQSVQKAHFSTNYLGRSGSPLPGHFELSFSQTQVTRERRDECGGGGEAARRVSISGLIPELPAGRPCSLHCPVQTSSFTSHFPATTASLSLRLKMQNKNKKTRTKHHKKNKQEHNQNKPLIKSKTTLCGTDPNVQQGPNPCLS